MANKRNKYRDEEAEFNDIANTPKQNTYTSAINGNVKFDIASVIPKDLKIIAKNESQKKLIQSIRNNEITICTGLPGCGKTFIALSQALSLLRKEQSPYKKIYLVKSVTSLSGEELGFLKGGLADKIDPFMWSYYINIEKIIHENSLKALLEREIIKPFPLAFMRGVTLDDCIIIADEMQNVSMGNSRTLITRIGTNAKLILLGDTKQIDIRNKHESSLITLLSIFKDTEGISVVQMDEKDENVRNPIIAKIEEKYNEYYKQKDDDRKSTERKPS